MRASGYERAAADWYVEPAWLVHALLDVERFPGPIWDPACGGGTIPMACTERGLDACGSDIVDRGYGIAPVDFTIDSLPGAEKGSIIMNPPFGLAEIFVRRALKVAEFKVAIVARLAFLEGVSRRDGLFAEAPLARVWVSSKRVSMPPGGMPEVEAKGGSVAFAWFVFEHGWRGPAQVGWL